MRIAFNLLKQPFLKLFGFIMILEVLIFIALILAYYGPAEIAKDKSKEKVKNNCKDLIISFSNLLIQKHSSILKELLIIRKHMSFIKTETNVNKSLESFGSNCILANDDLNNYLVTTQGGITVQDTYNEYYLIDFFLWDRDNLYYNNITDTSKDNQYFINKLLDPSYPLSRISTNTNITFLESHNYNPLKICYVASILKSFVTKDIVQLSPYKQYSIMSDDLNYFIYPMEITDFFFLKTFPGYSMEKDDCKNNYISKKCFSIFKNVKATDQILYELPVVMSNFAVGVRSKTCTRLELEKNRSDQWICIDFDLLFDLLYRYRQYSNNPKTTVTNYLVSYEGPNLKLLYSNDLVNITNNLNVYDNKSLLRYRFNSETAADALELFHGLYYNLFLHFPNLMENESIINKLISNYEYIKNNITDMIMIYEKNITSSEFLKQRISDEYHSSVKYLFDPLIREVNLNFMGYKMDYKSFQSKLLVKYYIYQLFIYYIY